DPLRQRLVAVARRTRAVEFGQYAMGERGGTRPTARKRERDQDVVIVRGIGCAGGNRSLDAARPVVREWLIARKVMRRPGAGDGQRRQRHGYPYAIREHSEPPRSPAISTVARRRQSRKLHPSPTGGGSAMRSEAGI